MTKDGPRSWLVCLACFFIWMCTFGFQFSYGVIFSELLQDFKDTRSKTAWAGSLSAALSCFLAPLTMSLARRFEEWQVMLGGTLGIASSLLLSSRVSNIEEMIVSFGILYGVSSACLYPLTQTTLKRAFDKRLSLSLGLSSTGSSLGPLIFSPILSIAMKHFGWRTTFQILAGVFTIILIFSVACCYTKREIECNNNEDENFHKANISQKYLTLLKHPPFMIYSTALAIVCLEYVVSHTHQVQYAIEFGISKANAELIPTYMALGNTFGRIAFGLLFDLQVADKMYLFQVVIFLTSATAFLGELTSSYQQLVVYFALLMTFDGGFQGQVFHAMCLVVECDKIYEAWQIVLLMQGVSIGLGPPLVGLIVDKTQNYSSIFYMTGTPLAVGGILLFTLRCFWRRESRLNIDTMNHCKESARRKMMDDDLCDKDCLIYRESVV